MKLDTSQNIVSERSRAEHLGPERRKPEVLDVAMAIAVAEGLDKVNMSKLATKLGVTRPVIYACFPDRLALINALLDRESEALTNVIIVALKSSQGATGPEQAFVMGYQAMLRAVKENPGPWKLFFLGTSEPSVTARFQKGRELIKRQASAWIKPAVVGWWSADKLERKLPIMVEFFLSACESTIRSSIHEESWSEEELGELVGKAVFRAFEETFA